MLFRIRERHAVGFEAIKLHNGKKCVSFTFTSFANSTLVNFNCKRQHLLCYIYSISSDAILLDSDANLMYGRESIGIATKRLGKSSLSQILVLSIKNDVKNTKESDK